MRILCCGNRDRGDDGAAVLVAERLDQLGISAEIYEGDPLAIMDRWNSADEVIVVDAMVTGAPPGTVRVWGVPLPANVFGASASTHGLGVAEAIRLAQIMGRLPRDLRVYGMEGKQFHPGADVSPEVRRAADTVATQIAAELAPAVPIAARREHAD